MKNLILLLIIGCISFFGWLHFQDQQEKKRIAEEAAAAAAAAAAAKPLAPSGVFYLLQQVASVPVPGSGAFVATAGTKVTLVRDGSPMRVTDGRHEYNVLPAQVTNDISTGEQLAKEQTLKAAEFAARQQKIAEIRQKIRNDRQAIYEARASQGVKKDMPKLQGIIDTKNAEVLKLQSELDQLEKLGAKASIP